MSGRKKVFLLKFSNKNTFFLQEMIKLTVVLKSITWLNKIERPLRFKWIGHPRPQFLMGSTVDATKINIPEYKPV